MLPKKPDLGVVKNVDSTLIAYLNSRERWVDSAVPKKTTNTDLHLYADADNGDDTNSGLEGGKAKKTLKGLSTAVPNLVVNTLYIHLRGSFDDIGFVTLIDAYDQSGAIIIDGGDGLTEVVAARTITSATAFQLTDSTLALTTDEHAGYFVEMLTGPTAGQIRQICEHDATTIYLNAITNGTPQVGDTFRIVRPATTISQASGFGGIILRNASNVRLQRLYFTGAALNIYFYCPVYCNGVVCENLSPSGGIHVRNSDLAYLGTSGRYNVHDGSYISSSVFNGGFSAKGTGTIAVAFVSEIVLQYGYFGMPVRFYQCPNTRLHLGVRCVSGVKMYNCGSSEQYSTQANLRGSSAAYPSTVENAGGVGMHIEGCYARIDSSGTRIRDCGSHAIEAISSYVKFVTGGIVGSGNGGFDIYAHLGSRVSFLDGSPPNLGGALGDISSDGAAEGSTWATVDGGTPYSDTTQLVVVDEV